jgi:hypothetical protein
MTRPTLFGFEIGSSVLEERTALGISEFKNLARFDTLQAYYSIAGRDL